MGAGDGANTSLSLLNYDEKSMARREGFEPSQDFSHGLSRPASFVSSKPIWFQENHLIISARINTGFATPSQPSGRDEHASHEIGANRRVRAGANVIR